MKKFDFKANKVFLISASLVIAVTITLLICFTVFKPKTELSKYFGANVELKNETSVQDIKDTKKYLVEHKKENYTVYSSKVLYTHDGVVDIWVVIKPSKKTDVVLENMSEKSFNDSQNRSFIKTTMDYVDNNLQDITYETLKDNNNNVNTGATIGTGAIKERVLSILVLNFNIVTENLETRLASIFGDNYINTPIDGTLFKEEEGSDKTNMVQRVAEIKSEEGSSISKHGYLYEVTAYGIYVNMPEYDMVESGKVLVRVILDYEDNDTFLGYWVDEKNKSEYQHTDSYANYLKTYLDSLVGKKISEIPSLGDNLGASNTIDTVYRAFLYLIDKKGSE